MRGARGVWQFMPETAKGMGLEVKQYDERYRKNQRKAACDFILKAKSKIRFWTLAAASYNRGVAGVRRLMEFQKETNYYDLYMNEETSRYV
jgi:soluble lytic murein transglycosylase-like protein